MDRQIAEKKWDLVVIGGGVTGAGVFREAVRNGCSVLLVEQNDFAWGTSSRSSKMVHGGLRYLKEGRFLLTRTSVKERERLLREAPGLVEPLEILVPVYSDVGPGKRALEIGLSIYGIMAHEKQHSYLNPTLFQSLVPDIKTENLIGGYRFWDAQVDDARLVLRLINEGIADGGVAMNYTIASRIQRNADDYVERLFLQDVESKEEVWVNTKAIVNATGSWAETLHPSPKSNLHLRALRGSHLILPLDRIPVSQAVSFIHPADKRPIFITPWEGCMLCGTTDVDHEDNLSDEPKASKLEIQYLLDGIRHYFPSLDIRLEDCIASMAGVRPVLSEGKLPPSKESRENVVWVDNGLVTVTGGKLTTFRKMAFETLRAVRPFLPALPKNLKDDPVFERLPPEMPEDMGVAPGIWRRLFGRYGNNAESLIRMSKPEDLELIPGTHFVWAELPHAAGREQIRHLSDLLLRRVRIGVLLSKGGIELMSRVEALCRSVLPWDDKRWDAEKRDYAKLVENAYAIPSS